MAAMKSGHRLLSQSELERADADEHLPFGRFAPSRWQNGLLALASRTVLRRGLFRPVVARLARAGGNRPLDIVFRDCAYRLHAPGGAIELGILLNPRYNAADIDFLLDGVEPGGVFVDIGANIGLFTLPLARKAGPEGRIVAIDANPRAARRLAWNAAASDIDTIAIFCVAVSDRDGAGSLSIRNEDDGTISLDEDDGGSVRVRTLASILREAGIGRIDGLKIDVEGHEDRALAPFLEAADEALLPRRIVIERPPGGGEQDYPACAAALERRGYRLAGRSRNNSFHLRA